MNYEIQEYHKKYFMYSFSNLWLSLKYNQKTYLIFKVRQIFAELFLW